MLCRKCKTKLKEISQGFDGFSFLNPSISRILQYCENNKCDEFGYVVVIGYPEEIITPLVNK